MVTSFPASLRDADHDDFRLEYQTKVPYPGHKCEGCGRPNADLRAIKRFPMLTKFTEKYGLKERDVIFSANVFFFFSAVFYRAGTSNPTFLLQKNGQEFVLRHKSPVQVYAGFHKVKVCCIGSIYWDDENI